MVADTVQGRISAKGEVNDYKRLAVGGGEAEEGGFGTGKEGRRVNGMNLSARVKPHIYRKR